jgi:hypothetical protein
MGLLIFFLVAVKIDKIVDVRFVEYAPVVDGVIEEVWQIADSAYNFSQVTPYEKEQPNEKTVVYALQDKENLYIAFRCYADSLKPICRLSGNEDDIKIAIDPFGSKTTAYFFVVNASKRFDDGWILDDGRRLDDSWEGIWYHAVKLYDDRYEVEVKIPFKSIRYKEGLNEWGINFARHIACNNETDSWTEISQIEHNMVSKFGKLKGVEPYASGYYFEIYPEGFVRYDNYGEEKGKFNPNGSLNFKWDFTSQMTINATLNPDFAQIESDPFQLNLGRYPTYLDERRPFFLEGKDIFHLSDFGRHVGFFEPLNIFYSRKIGKSADGEMVPILGGLKFTNKSEDWSIGALGAYTDDLTYMEGDTLEVTEPERIFGGIRVKRKILDNSDIGMMLSGNWVNKDTFNYAVGLDGVYRSGFNQFIMQGAFSNSSNKEGWATNCGFFGLIGDFLTIASIEVVQDSFDVSDIGYVPWAGRRKIILSTGPFKTYQKGIFSNLFYGGGFIGIREPEEKEWSKLGYLIYDPNFRNDWGLNFEVRAGPYYEADTNYFYRSISLFVYGNGNNYRLSFGGYFGYSYNYNQEYLAYQASKRFRGSYTLTPRIRVSLSSNIWFEWNPSNKLIAITPNITPRINFRINPDMSLDIFNEFVMESPGTNFRKTELSSNRVGFLFSWRFAPKSWLYIALHDHREQDDYGDFKLESQIAAIKAKYLIYF